MKHIACGVIVAALLAGCTHDQTLTRFRANLAAQDSATVALEHWCAARAIATPAHIEATTRDDAAAAPATAAIRAAVEVGPDEPVRVRHVLLSCGGIVLSDARNWYVPARLTPDMNRMLDASRVPFGKVVAPLGLHRRAWRKRSPASCPAGTILHNTAVLRRDNGLAYSLVSECYTRANISPLRG
jgi:chorismate-pyruvate lyase